MHPDVAHAWQNQALRLIPEVAAKFGHDSEAWSGHIWSRTPRRSDHDGGVPSGA
jgi:hypothetical protein